MGCFDTSERVSFSGPFLFPYHSVLLVFGRRVLGFGGTCRGGLRLLFENCTVDASIFVVKLLRAHGGCLGTRSRRRT